MSAQTQYNLYHQTALVGMLFGLGVTNVVSRSLEDADGADFGVAMGRGAESTTTVKGGSSFLGISLRSVEREVHSDGVTRYGQKETVAVLREGSVHVKCPSGCNPGDAVKYNASTGVIDAGTAGSGEVQLLDARWESKTNANEIGVLFLAGFQTAVGS